MSDPVFTDGADSFTVASTGEVSLSFLGGNDTLVVKGGTATMADMGEGNDYVRLQWGAATVDGGGGADRFDIWTSGAVVSGGDGADLFTLRGGSGQVIHGDGGNDRVNLGHDIRDVTIDLGIGDDVFVGYGRALTGSIYGGEGWDKFIDLDGRGGLDLQGGPGNDIYRVSAASSGTIIEYAGEGIDTVQLAAGWDYQLPDNVEDIDVRLYAGSVATAATITANAANNVIVGSLNAETIHGLDGNDYLFGRNGDDQLWGGDGKDLLDGGFGNDLLYGEAGNDVLNGRAGDDFMGGGVGNDIYYVDSVGDLVTENLDEGTDTVRTTVDFTLPDNVERCVIASLAGLTVYGNVLDNRLYGAAGDDTIFADGGNDFVKGGAGNDYLGGEAGNDTVVGGAGNDYLFGDEGNDWVIGGTGDDYLQGYTGNDILDGGIGGDFLAGGPGADKLIGGSGSDCFFFYDAQDSTPAAADRITDFVSLQGEGNGDDQIDLSLIDANANLDGDQAFAGLGTSAAAYALWYSVGASANGAQDWAIYGDTDGNPATIEFELHVHSLMDALFLDDITL